MLLMWIYSHFTLRLIPFPISTQCVLLCIFIFIFEGGFKPGQIVVTVVSLYDLDRKRFVIVKYKSARPTSGKARYLSSTST